MRRDAPDRVRLLKLLMLHASQSALVDMKLSSNETNGSLARLGEEAARVGRNRHCAECKHPAQFDSDISPYGGWAIVSLLLAITTSPAPARAFQTDRVLGEQWAVCAEEAGIRARMATSSELQHTLRQASAVFEAYATAAAGADEADARRAEVERTFVASSVARTSTANKRKFFQEWSAEAERRAGLCRQSFALHSSRFKARVQELVQPKDSRRGVR